MTTLNVKLPGIGGSLGECVFCGDTFLKEILLGQSVDTFQIDAFGDKSLPAHKKCLDSFRHRNNVPWEELPEGPLRRCFAAWFENQPQEASEA